GGGERFTVFLGRHGVILIVKAKDKFAAFQVIGVDSFDSFPVLDGGGVAVEAEFFGLFSIGPVTGEAFVGEDGENFAGEVDFFLSKEEAGQSCCDEGCGDYEAKGHTSW
ncbi:MAG: hypothetical protein ACI8UZ_001038, partial [Akkermansiaceae bacterium]